MAKKIWSKRSGYQETKYLNLGRTLVKNLERNHDRLVIGASQQALVVGS